MAVEVIGPKMPSKGPISLDTQDTLLLEETFALFDELARNPEKPRNFLHRMLDIVAKELATSRAELQSPDFQENVIESFQELGKEARTIAEEYYFDSLVAEMTFEHLSVFQEKLKEKIDQSKADKKRQVCEKLFGFPIIMRKTGEKSYELECERNGVKVHAKLEERTDEYGASLYIDQLTLGENIVRINGDQLRKSVGALPAILEKYDQWKMDVSTFADEVRSATLFYDPPKKMFFLQAGKDAAAIWQERKTAYVVIGEGEPSTEVRSFYNSDGKLRFREEDFGSNFIYSEIFDEFGEKVMTYREWIEKNGFADELESKDDYITTYLAPKLRNEEVLDLFFAKMMRYTSDSNSSPQYILRRLPERPYPGIENMPEKWQTWDKTLERESYGAYLGDCDDYAFLAKRIFEAQGRKNVHVLIIPQHATTISIDQKPDGMYEVIDIGTFPLEKVQGNTLDEALQKILDRYKQTGLGVWQGRQLHFDPHHIEIADTKFEERTLFGREKAETNTMTTFVVSSAALVDPRRLNTLKDAQEAIWERYVTAELKIQAAQKEFPDEILLGKFDAIQHYMRGNYEASAEKLLAHIEANGNHQEDYEMVLNILLPDEARFKEFLEVMLRKLDEVEYSPGLTEILKSIKLNFDYLLKLKVKIAERGRQDFLLDILESTRYSHDKDPRWLDAVRELARGIKSSSDVGYMRKSVLEELVERLPPEDQIAVSTAVLEENPEDLVFNRIFFKNLVKAEKYELVIYLLESGNFDEIFSAMGRDVLLAEAYFGMKNYDKAIFLASPHLPRSRYLPNGTLLIREDSMMEFDDSFKAEDILLESFMAYSPKQGRAFYMDHIQHQSPEYDHMPGTITADWLRCKYTSEKIDRKAFFEDYKIFKDKKYTLKQRAEYLTESAELFMQKLLEQYKNAVFIPENEDMKTLKFIAGELKEIDTAMKAKYGHIKSIPSELSRSHESQIVMQKIVTAQGSVVTLTADTISKISTFLNERGVPDFSF